MTIGDFGQTGPSLADIRKATDDVRNAESQPAPETNEPTDPLAAQQVPYNRFKEVNDQKNQYEGRTLELERQLAALQAQPRQPEPVQTPQPTGPKPLFTEDELSTFENNMLTDTRGTLTGFAQAIIDRAVKPQVEQLRQDYDQRFAQETSRFSQAVAPMAMQQYKAGAFNTPQYKAAEPIFDQLVQQQVQNGNSGILTDTNALNNLRTLAFGAAAERGLLNNLPTTQPKQQLPFSESPGGQSAFGGMFGGQQADDSIPPQIVQIAQKMKIDPREYWNLYKGMEKSGAFQNF